MGPLWDSLCRAHSSFALWGPSVGFLWASPPLDLPTESPQRGPKGQNCCGPRIGLPTWGPRGISVGLPCPHFPTVNPHILTVGPHGHVCLGLPLTSKVVWDLRALLGEKIHVLKAQAILATLTKVQDTSRPSSATIHGKLEDLYMLYEYGSTAGAEVWRPETREQLRVLDWGEKVPCSQFFQQTMAECSAKLQAVM